MISIYILLIFILMIKSVSFLCIYIKYRKAKPEVVNNSTEREADSKGKI